MIFEKAIMILVFCYRKCSVVDGFRRHFFSRSRQTRRHSLPILLERPASPFWAEDAKLRTAQRLTNLIAASWLLFSVNTSATISLVWGFTDRCSFRHVCRFDLPWVRIFHSPSPNTFKPVLSTTISMFQHLVHAQIAGVVPPLKTSQWLSEIGKRVRDKLVKFGLIEDRADEALHDITLSELIEQFKKQKKR